MIFLIIAIGIYLRTTLSILMPLPHLALYIEQCDFDTVTYMFIGDLLARSDMMIPSILYRTFGQMCILSRMRPYGEFPIWLYTPLLPISVIISLFTEHPYLYVFYTYILITTFCYSTMSLPRDQIGMSLQLLSIPAGLYDPTIGSLLYWSSIYTLTTRRH